jgi:uncharacterized protein YciI
MAWLRKSLLKRLIQIFIIGIFIFNGNTTNISAQVKISESGYKYFEMTSGDSTIIMREYFMCFLKIGKNRNQSEIEANEIQAGHLAHLAKLHEEGNTCVTGPLGDDGEIRGIVIYTVNSQEKAEKLANMDPAVKSGRLTVEIHPWWAMKGAVLK